MSKMNLYEIITNLQNGTLDNIKEEDVKGQMFSILRMYYPQIGIANGTLINNLSFPTNWNLLKSLVGGSPCRLAKSFSKGKVLDKMIEKNIPSITHQNEICHYYNIDYKTLLLLLDNALISKEIKSIDEIFDKIIQEK